MFVFAIYASANTIRHDKSACCWLVSARMVAHLLPFLYRPTSPSIHSTRAQIHTNTHTELHNYRDTKLYTTGSTHLRFDVRRLYDPLCCCCCCNIPSACKRAFDASPIATLSWVLSQCEWVAHTLADAITHCWFQLQHTLPWCARSTLGPQLPRSGTTIPVNPVVRDRAIVTSASLAVFLSRALCLRKPPMMKHTHVFTLLCVLFAYTCTSHSIVYTNIFVYLVYQQLREVVNIYRFTSSDTFVSLYYTWKYFDVNIFFRNIRNYYFE